MERFVHWLAPGIQLQSWLKKIWHQSLLPSKSKVGCVFSMIVISTLLQEEFERNDHREDALHFIWLWFKSDMVIKKF